jgi:hypothetical protein
MTHIWPAGLAPIIRALLLRCAKNKCPAQNRAR